MKQYLELLRHVKSEGIKKEDRTGTGTLSVFGYQMRFDLNEGFPLVTTKEIHLKSVIFELLWFLQGDTNIKYLNDNGVSIWDEWANKDGDLGPVYGAQWRSWRTNNKTVDQITEVIEEIKCNPKSRRLIVSAWNVGEISNMALAPCHALFQFNIASYALLLMMVAKVTKLKLGEFIHTFGDAHLYLNHLDQVDEQLKRKPYALPQMKLNTDIDDIFKFRYEHFELNNYQAHSKISAPIAI